MINFLLNLPLSDQLLGLAVALALSFVMFRSLLSFSRSSSAGWYGGFQSTAVFQLLMWACALPFLVPAVCLYLIRRAKLRDARLIGNVGSRVFHSPRCEYQVRMKSNLLRYPLGSREEALRRGFRPCAWCQSGR